MDLVFSSLRDEHLKSFVYSVAVGGGLLQYSPSSACMYHVASVLVQKWESLLLAATAGYDEF